jgi:hypothetical protein
LRPAASAPRRAGGSGSVVAGLTLRSPREAADRTRDFAYAPVSRPCVVARPTSTDARSVRNQDANAGRTFSANRAAGSRTSRPNISMTKWVQPLST